MMAGSDAFIGQTISHYRILEKLGGGGKILAFFATRGLYEPNKAQVILRKALPSRFGILH